MALDVSGQGISINGRVPVNFVHGCDLQLRSVNFIFLLNFASAGFLGTGM